MATKKQQSRQAPARRHARAAVLALLCPRGERRAGGGPGEGRRRESAHGPMDVPGGDRIAQFMDPQGAVFAVHWKKGT